MLFHFFEMLSSDLRSNCRCLIHLRYIKPKFEETVDGIFVPLISSVLF